uniref:Immunoglobulin V-set domain-containing protein n=2 Tax=Monopterus albus TaxID=43700 RepID=A0A3Q3J935_MONAL
MRIVQMIKMSVCWILMILLGCRTSHATQSQSNCTCNDHLKTVCESHRGTVHVQCPNVTTEKSEVRFRLYKDRKIISSLSCSRNKTVYGWTCTSESTEEGVSPNIKHTSVSFALTALTNSSQGIYSCESTIEFPPPFTKSTLSILVLVHEYQCMCIEDSNNVNHGFHWIWILVAVLLLIYSLTVTIIASVVWVKMRRMDSQSDYMNTKPRGPRERRKKKGIQNPIQRHF